MKNIIITILVTLFVIVGISFLFTDSPIDLKGGELRPYNGITSGATTTSADNMPVRVLDTNQSRRYAKITNDSGTVVYLHAVNFANQSAASTTVILNSGIRLNASGGTFEIDYDNLYTGQLWATSSAGALNIIYVEK